MKKREFLKARNAYLIAKAACEVAQEESDAAERKLVYQHGFGNNLIWTADIDESTFEKLCEEFEKKYPREISELADAKATLADTEKMFAEIAIKDIPLPPAERAAFAQKVKSNAAIRGKVIDLALRLNVRTIP